MHLSTLLFRSVSLCGLPESLLLLDISTYVIKPEKLVFGGYIAMGVVEG